MIICRKCQRHHPDDAGTGSCECGADLRKDGIRLVSAPTAPGGGSPAPPDLPAPSTREDSGADLTESTGSVEEVPIPPAAETTAAPARRARSVNPRDLLAADDAPDAPNVGAPQGDAGDLPAEGAPVDEDPSAASTLESEPVPAVLRQGEVACPACAEPNPASRRLCISCGRALPGETRGPVATSPARGSGAADSVWRRLTGTSSRHGLDRRTWQQKARDAGHERFRYGTGYSPRAKLTAAVAAIGLGAGTLGLAGPWRERAVELVRGKADGDSPASAELIGEDAVPRFPAAQVHDGDTSTGVGLRFDAESDAEPGVLRITLAEPTTVRKVHLAGGLGSGDDAALVLRPRVVRVCPEAGECQTLQLRDAASLQALSVAFPGPVQTLDISVHDVHPPRTTTYPLVVISEIRVQS